jgi:hypothetical protein
VTGGKRFGFKIFKHLIHEGNDNAKLNIIKEKERIQYYQQMPVVEEEEGPRICNS